MKAYVGTDDLTSFSTKDKEGHLHYLSSIYRFHSFGGLNQEERYPIAQVQSLLYGSGYHSVRSYFTTGNKI